MKLCSYLVLCLWLPSHRNVHDSQAKLVSRVFCLNSVFIVFHLLHSFWRKVPLAHCRGSLPKSLNIGKWVNIDHLVVSTNGGTTKSSIFYRIFHWKPSIWWYPPWLWKALFLSFWDDFANEHRLPYVLPLKAQLWPAIGILIKQAVSRDGLRPNF